jgi:uncharacterized protein YaaW (UPF0174 family)
MSYRIDPDLEFISKASNDDLLLLADALMYKDAKHREKKSPRGTATLYLDDKFEANYPHNMTALWQPIAEELQKFGGHSGVNWIFRRNKGVLYREILIDVCKRQKVKNVNYKADDISSIENAFLQKTVELAIEKMSESDRRELIDGLRNVEALGDQLKKAVISKEGLLNLVQLAFKQGGFKSYILTLQVVNGISKAVLGRGLSLGANAALMKYIGSFMSGPWGWAFAAVTTVWDIMGPNRDASLKGVAIVSYMRKKMELGL